MTPEKYLEWEMQRKAGPDLYKAAKETLAVLDTFAKVRAVSALTNDELYFIEPRTWLRNAIAKAEGRNND